MRFALNIVVCAVIVALSILAAASCNQGGAKNAPYNATTTDTFPDYTDQHLKVSLARPMDDEWPPIRQRLRLKPGMTVADVGCGVGAVTFLLSKEVGPTGKVYALEIQQKCIDAVKVKIADHEINPYNNVSPVLNRPDSTLLDPNVLDVAMLINIHFHLHDPLLPENVNMIKSIFQAVKPGGRLMIEDANPYEPPDSIEQCVRNFEAAGFLLESGPDVFGEAQADPTFYLTFKKPSQPAS